MLYVVYCMYFETNARPSGALAGEARPCLPDLLQKYIHKIWGSEDQRIRGSENFGRRELIWIPPKNTLLLWMVFIGFYFLWISQKLQYFFYVFLIFVFLHFCLFLIQRKMEWWFLNMIYDLAPFGGTIAGASRRHGSPICYKKIYS